MQKNRGFVDVVIGIIILALCVIGLLYFLTTKQTTQVKNGAVVVQSTSNGIETYQTTVTANFEGESKISFSFDYPTDKYSVETVPNSGVQLIEKATGKTHSIIASFEGGRGYSPADYWDKIANSLCVDCAEASSPVSLGGSSSAVAYGSGTKLIEISTSPINNSWLVIFNLEQPTDSISQVLGTFKVTE